MSDEKLACLAEARAALWVALANLDRAKPETEKWTHVSAANWTTGSGTPSDTPPGIAEVVAKAAQRHADITARLLGVIADLARAEIDTIKTLNKPET